MRPLLFDFGGTLDSDGIPWIERFYPLYKESGVDAPRPAFDKAFYASDDSLAQRHRLTGLSLEETLLLQARGVLERLAPGRAGLATRIAGRFLEDSRKAFERNRPVLERLRARHSLGVVSNFYGNLDGVLRSEGLRDLFGVVADSGVLGQEKPAGGIFRHAASALGAEPAECVMVGDSIPRDMRGAEGLGMGHALLGASGKTRCCPRGLVLRALSELEALLS